MWVHVNDKLLVGNNSDKKISEAGKGDDSADHKEYFSYSLGNDFFKPCASYLHA